MMYYTHLAFGVLSSLLAIDFLKIENKILFILIVVLFSIFPDIDERKSKIGKKYKLASQIINFLFGHRGLFHTVYIPLIFYLVLYNLNRNIGLAILIGYLSHLFMDALTKKGIRPLAPIINIKINGPFKTNSFIEKILFLVILGVISYLVFL
jgi:inner membrane protein